jgi:hypothetical protein
MPKEEDQSQSAARVSGPTAQVPKDPQPSVDRIDDLARRILVGDILLPKFQRAFVWEKKQILRLLDSVTRTKAERGRFASIRKLPLPVF